MKKGNCAVIYTDLLLDDLCAIEYLSKYYSEAYIVIVNEQDLASSVYASKYVRTIDDVCVTVQRWFDSVFVGSSLSFISKDTCLQCDCFLLANATKLVADLESGIAFNNIFGMIGVSDEEWNASQDVVAYHKLQSFGFIQYGTDFCEKQEGYPDNSLEFLNEYISTMGDMGENICCYDLQAVGAAIRSTIN